MIPAATAPDSPPVPSAPIATTFPAPEPVDPDRLFQVAVETGYDRLYREMPGEAAGAFRVALALVPGFAEGWAVLGETFVVPAEIAGALGRAVRLAPGEWRWRLASAEAALRDDPSRAIDLFAGALATRPDSADARRGLARALARSGDRSLAVSEYRELRSLGKADPDDLRDMAALLIAIDQPERAAEVLAPSCSGDRPDPDALALAAEAWAALGERAKALKALDRALAAGALATPAVTALRRELTEGGEGRAAPPPTAAYVRALFDRYAERFDQELVDRLGYVGPQLLLSAVTAIRPDLAGARMFDLGCGTGLAGVAFRPLVSVLHGVDLSGAMVSKAERRTIYDHLVVGDLVSALDGSAGNWDLLVAADVFLYLGGLETVFAASARALAPDGLLAFTTEAREAVLEEAIADGERRDDGPILLRSRRYAHDAGYLASGLAEAGLVIASMDTVTLRWDRGAPIVGHRVVARKPVA